MTGFPDGFLWGAATAAHQVEGNNTNSDCWVMEFAPGTIFREPSGDACDHYRLYRDDLRTLRDLGFNAYRFSIEWARVEPEDGFVSRAALRHYGDVLESCHELGLTPVVTFHHFTSPRWLMKRGGWAGRETPTRFAAYSGAVMRELGSLIPYVCTINEANIATILRQLGVGLAPREGAASRAPVGVGGEAEGEAAGDAGWLAGCARELNTTPDRMKPFLFAEPEETKATIMVAHARAREAIKAVRAETRVGITLALHDVQAVPGGEERAAAVRAEAFHSWLPACAGDDFLGVQNYSRQRVGAAGILPNEEGVETTQMGYEFYPEALEGALRMAAGADLPMIVTENGVATEDDARRVAFIDRALAGVRRCLADGLDVRGYLYWSALDNFEWVFGYGPTFGLIAVDRATQARRVKESARHLGRIARAIGSGQARGA